MSHWLPPSTGSSPSSTWRRSRCSLRVSFGGDADAGFWAVFVLTLPTSVILMAPMVLYPLAAVGMVLHLPESVGGVLVWLVPAIVNMTLMLLVVRRRAVARPAWIPPRPSQPPPSTCGKALAIGYLGAVALLGAGWTEENGGLYLALLFLTMPVGMLFVFSPYALYGPYAFLSLLPGAGTVDAPLPASYAALLWVMPALGNVLLVRWLLRGHRAGPPVEMRLSRSGSGRGHGCVLLSPTRRSG